MFAQNSVDMLLALDEKNLSIAEYTLNYEAGENGDENAVLAKMEQMLSVMEAAALSGCEKPVFSISGLTGGNAFRYFQSKASDKSAKSLLGEVGSDGVAYALSSGENNSAMGRIVACPTAGSCGILPAAVLSVGRNYGKTREEMVMALMTASGVGMIIAKNATLSGAEGGCQAECGSAAAMAAAAIVEMLGGTPRQAFNAAAMTIKNVMGLVCDPVAGLVEIPCIKRNASGVLNALLCADLALAGVVNYIPFDDVISAMYAVGNQMDSTLKETAMGGLAVTEAAKRLEKQIMVKSED